MGVTTNGARGGSFFPKGPPKPISDQADNADLSGIVHQQPVKNGERQKVRELARKQLDRFISLQSKVLKGDSDAIHDIRVASRRLQEVVDLLYPDRPADITKLRRRIKRVRSCLSEVRNCDVLLKRVGRSLSVARVTRREAWECARNYLEERRSSSFEKAVRKLGRLHLAALYVKMRDRIRDEVQAADSNGNLAGSARASATPDGSFTGQLQHALRQSLREYEAAVKRSLDDSSGPMIHGVRISAKRLRYLIEILDEFHVEGSGEALNWLKRLQEHLGDWHDLEVLEEMLIDMVARPRFLRDHLDVAMMVEKLVLSHRVGKARYVDKYVEMIRSPREGQRLLDWGKMLAGEDAANAAEPSKPADLVVVRESLTVRDSS